MNPNIVHGKRVKRLVVRLLGKPNFYDNEYGGKWVFKMVDENDHIYYGSTSGYLGSEIIHNDDFNCTWYAIAFSPSIHEGKMYCKRITWLDIPIMDVKEYLQRKENDLYSTEVHDKENYTDAMRVEKEMITGLLNTRYKAA